MKVKVKVEVHATKTAEERAAAADALAKRETLLQPSYKQIALLYADLHE